jgi:CubicO group peptidase (beta-lactamase class C family)
VNIKKLLWPFLLLFAAVAAIRRLFASHPAASEALASGSAPFDAIDAYIEQQMRRLHIPGASLAIVEGDKIVHQRGFGRARPHGEAPTPQTPFVLGSTTKSFTALAVMQLVEEGKIELDAPVQRYLPWFRVADSQASAQMTVRHLLNQTSGLPGSSGEIQLADFDDSPGAAERQARALSTLVPARPVGSAFEYNNSNYSLLGLILQAASGESYADYVRNHIFIPLGMSHSYTSPAVAKQHGLAVGHQFWFMIPFAAPSMPLPHGSLPAGLLISSSEDMARWLIAHLNGGHYGDVQILSGAGIDELHRAAAEYHKMGISVQYGMGWFVSEMGPTKLVWHSGTLPDFASYMALLPEQKKGVVLLFNADHYWMNPVVADFGGGVAALLAGAQPAPTPFFHVVPWMLRAQLLVPALQMLDVVATLRRLRRWRLEPERRPSGGRAWGRHVLLPLIPNLLAALSLLPVLGKTRGFLRLYMPDCTWIARVCGSFALVWSFLRTGLILRAFRKQKSS